MKYIKADYDATIPEEILYAPDGDPNMLRNLYRTRAKEDAKKAEEAAKKEAHRKEINVLMEKYPEESIEASKESEKPIQSLFELTVPDYGSCDSVGGEIVRAMMRILYRDWNDGDVFYEGYGKETCLPCVAYLIEQFPDLYEDFEEIAYKELHDDRYTDAIQLISEEICNRLTGQVIELFWTPNEDDCLRGDISLYEDWEPEYEWEGEFPENLLIAQSMGRVNSTELRWDIESSLSGNGIEYDDLSVGEYGFTVYGLTRDDYDLLDEIGWSICEGLGEEYEEIEYDEDDEYDEADEYEEEENW